MLKPIKKFSLLEITNFFKLPQLNIITMNQLSRFLFAIFAFFPFLCTSCSDDAEERIEAAKIVESRNSQDLMNDLHCCPDKIPDA